jgi:hypothetical protein
VGSKRRRLAVEGQLLMLHHAAGINGDPHAASLVTFFQNPQGVFPPGISASMRSFVVS